MKLADIPNEVMRLSPCFIGEYRGSLIERVEWVDKTDGKAKGFVKAVHLFEFGTGGSVKPIQIEELIPKNITDPNQVEVKFKRGAWYLFALQSLQRERGHIQARMVADSPILELGR